MIVSLKNDRNGRGFAQKWAGLQNFARNHTIQTPFRKSWICHCIQYACDAFTFTNLFDMYLYDMQECFISEHLGLWMYIHCTYYIMVHFCCKPSTVHYNSACTWLANISSIWLHPFDSTHGQHILFLKYPQDFIDWKGGDNEDSILH